MTPHEFSQHVAKAVNVLLTGPDSLLDRLDDAWRVALGQIDRDAVPAGPPAGRFYAVHHRYGPDERNQVLKTLQGMRIPERQALAEEIFDLSRCLTAERGPEDTWSQDIGLRPAAPDS